VPTHDPLRGAGRRRLDAALRPAPPFRSGRGNPSRRQRGGLGGAEEVPQPRDLILREKHHLLRRRRRGLSFRLAYRAEEQPREHPPMVGTNLPNAPIPIALHDRALQAEGAAAAALAHHSHTLTVARPSAIRLAVLRRPRAVDDLRDAPADVSHRTGSPPNPPPFVGTSLADCALCALTPSFPLASPTGALPDARTSSTKLR
jgi:hypothetical protein